MTAGMPRNPAWSADEDQVLRDLWWNTGASVLALRLNRTRVAVKARVQKLRLKKAARPVPQPTLTPPPAPAPAGIALPVPQPAALRAERVSALQLVPPAARQRVPAGAPVAEHVRQLASHDCRYIFGDPVTPDAKVPFRFCAERVTGEGSSYCAEHARLCGAGRMPALRLGSRTGALHGRAA